MDSSVATPAPAPAEAPTTVSATVDAANHGDFKAFDKAHTSAKQGTPLPEVSVTPAEAAPVADAPVVPERKTSNRQQQINDAARTAAEQATTALRDENARLKAQLEGRTAPPEPKATPPAAPAPPVEKFPTLAEYSAQHPDASMEDFLDARDEFRAGAAERQAQTRASAAEIDTALRTRAEAFGTRLKEASTADPDFATTLTEDVKAIKPFGALAKDEKPGPRNIIGELFYDSPQVAAIARHLSQHPEVLTALETMPAAIAALPVALRTSAHIQHIVKTFGALEASLTSPAAADPVAAPSTITAAPPPAPTLTRAGSTADPKAAALKRGDFVMWEKLDTADKLARKQRPSA